ncbi:MAG TPA: phosphate acyltransferase [archaeon]|nr:phosphate acyltransferase [archaeon]
MGYRTISQMKELVEEATELAAQCRPALVVAGADDPATLASVWEASRKKLVRGILVGESGLVREAAGKTGADLGEFELVNTSPSRQEIIERSLDLLGQEPGELLMKGSLKTSELLGGYLERRRGFRTGRFLSHLGVFNAPGEKRLMIITDGGMNLQPDLERKKDILLNAVDVAHLLGIDCPRVAVLAHVEKSPDHGLTMIHDAEELVRMNREGSLPGCVVDGPLALDNAVSLEAASRKGIESPVAGRADILLANEIGMGNVIYKVVQTWLDGTIAGLVAGGRIPVITPSRADSEESKLAAIALGVIMVTRKQN